MAKARKTIEVATMLEWANDMLAYDGHDQGYKSGVCTMIERLLINAGCYNGFHYIHPTIPNNEYSRQYYAL